MSFQALVNDLWEGVKERQETITSERDSLTGAYAASPLFHACIRCLDTTTATKPDIRQAFMIAMNEHPHDVGSLIDCCEHEKDAEVWLDDALKRVNATAVDPLDAASRIDELPVYAYFGRRGNGQLRHQMACRVLSFVLVASGSREGSTVGLGERQIAKALGTSHQTTHTAMKFLNESGLIEVADPHLFISEGHHDNRVTVWSVCWDQIKESWALALSKISRFFHSWSSRLRESLRQSQSSGVENRPDIGNRECNRGRESIRGKQAEVQEPFADSWWDSGGDPEPVPS